MAMWGEDDSFDGAFTFGSVAKPKNSVRKSNKLAENGLSKKYLKDGGVAGKRGMSPERGNARKKSRVSSSPRGQI